MRYLCILGNDNEYTANICNKISKLGYTSNPLWATRKFEYTEVLSETNFDRTVDENRMIQLSVEDNIKYGILRPVGSKKYITHVNVNQFNSIKDIYGDQARGFYISYIKSGEALYVDPDQANKLDSLGCGFIICSDRTGENNVVAEILKQEKYWP